ncbi:hypothetical protein CHUAL_008049 [Chamberlinius hualienensis]
MYHRTTAIGNTRARPSIPASRVGPMVITSLRNVNLQGQRHPTSSGSKPVEKTVVKVTSKENVGFGQHMLKKVSKPSSATAVKVVTSAERIPQRPQLRHVCSSKSRVIPVAIMRNWRAGSRSYFRPRPASAPKTVVKVTSQEAVGFGQGMLKKVTPKTTVKITTSAKRISKRRRLRHVSSPRRKIYPVNILRNWRSERKVRRRTPSIKTVVQVTSNQNIGRRKLRRVTRRPQTTIKVSSTTQFRPRLRHVSPAKRKMYSTRIYRNWKNERRVKRRPTKRISQIKITAFDHGMGRVRRASKRIAPVLPIITFRAPPTRMAVKPAAHHGPEVAITTYRKRK